MPAHNHEVLSHKGAHSVLMACRRIARPVRNRAGPARPSTRATHTSHSEMSSSAGFLDFICMWMYMHVCILVGVCLCVCVCVCVCIRLVNAVLVLFASSYPSITKIQPFMYLYPYVHNTHARTHGCTHTRTCRRRVHMKVTPVASRPARPRLSDPSHVCRGCPSPPNAPSSGAWPVRKALTVCESRHFS